MLQEELYFPPLLHKIARNGWLHWSSFQATPTNTKKRSRIQHLIVGELVGQRQSSTDVRQNIDR